MQLDDTTTVLVTGANGFVGARAVARIAASGANVRAMVRTAGSAPVVAGSVEVVGDFADAADAQRAMEGVDAVVHTAATAGPDWDHVRHVNTHGTAVIADAAADVGIKRFVHISTFSVYDRSPDLVEINEDTPTVDPDADDANPYSVTKLEAEGVVISRAQTRDLPVVILRPPAVLGHGPTSTWGHKLPVSVQDGDPLVKGPADNHMSYVHVDDLVDAAIAGLRAETITSGRAYDVVHDTVVWSRYLDDLRAMFPEAPDLPPYPDSQPWTGTVQHRRLTDELDFTPTRDYETAMAEIRDAWTS